MPSYEQVQDMWKVEKELGINRDGTPKSPQEQTVIFTGEKITNNFNNQNDEEIDKKDQE